jgi:hypothetical protein
VAQELRLVAKLRTARERKRKTAGKCEGRKSWAEINPELVRQAKRLRRRSPKGHQRSLRDIARELEGLGYVNQRGKRFSAASVQSMLSLMKNGPSAEFAGRKDPCFIRGTVKQVAIGGGNCETLSRDHWNQRCILGSLCRHLHGVHGPAAGTGAICGATQRPGALSRLCRRKAALVHLVSRKGLHRLAGARRKVHLSAGQHVHELQTAARGCEVKRRAHIL